MQPDSAESLVTVYSTPLPFDAVLVKAMLSDEGIPEFVEDTNVPFAGLSALPCHVMVERVHEAAARRLIEEHEARHRMRMDRAWEKETEEAALDESRS
jgi:hypothetical protein